ncbi:MAG: glycoside hydrolase family protein [Spirulinaceae cyanobacterium]
MTRSNWLSQANNNQVKQSLYYQNKASLIQRKKKSHSGSKLIFLTFLGFLILCFHIASNNKAFLLKQAGYISPLAMTGGNPYIRALMRTISVSEAKDSSPYTLLYGGEHITDLSRHPDQCITIVSGPNEGNCSTAAGRYQILTTTWQEKVSKYGQGNTQIYGFQPFSQDQVVYAWLSDQQAWGENISVLLQEGKVEEVLQILSGTWTSLGYGIENNQLTPLLPEIYEQVLAEELAK